MRYFFAWFMFKHLYPSSPILQMLVHDPKKRVAILYVFNTLQSCMDVGQENGY